MEGSFESILESTKELLKKNEILSKILEEKLNKVCEIEQHLEVINQICDMESDENQGVGAVRDTCKALAYGGYLKEKTDAAGLEHVVKKMEIEKFPESIQPKGYEIKGYVEQIAVQLEKVDNLINEIGEMIQESRKNQYRISETERIDLEMKMLDFEGGLEKCTGYQEQAAKAMEELKWEVDDYAARQEKLLILKDSTLAWLVPEAYLFTKYFMDENYIHPGIFLGRALAMG
ncbi:hypothetical protein ACROYT_G011691 [Oculina patagonica]